MKDYIEVGQIVNTHGLKGEVKVNPWTDSPDFFEVFGSVYTKNGRQYDIKGIKYQKGCVLLKLDGVETIDDAERMRNTVLYVKRNIFDNLPENTYLIADLIGLCVKDETTDYGILEDVISTGSNDVYVVRGQESSKPILIPAIRDVVREINIKEGYIFVNIPKGLID